MVGSHQFYLQLQSPLGWDQDTELDYTEAVRKKEVREREERDKGLYYMLLCAIYYVVGHSSSNSSTSFTLSCHCALR